MCEEGALRPMRYSGQLKWRGKLVEVMNLDCWECPDCGADPVFEDQICRNDRRYTEARRQADGLLSGAATRDIRRHLGLSRNEATELMYPFGKGFSALERGDAVQDLALDRLLQMLSLQPELLHLVWALAGLQGYSERCFGYRTVGRIFAGTELRRPYCLPGNPVQVRDMDWH